MSDTNFNSVKVDTLGVNDYAGVFYPKTPVNATVVAKASSGTLAASDFDKNLTNTGASGTVVLTLPAAASYTRRTFRVYLTAAQIVRLDPQSTESIYLGGSGVAGKYVNIAAVIGNYVDVYCDGTSYYVTDYSGVVTVEA